MVALLLLDVIFSLPVPPPVSLFSSCSAGKEISPFPFLKRNLYESSPPSYSISHAYVVSFSFVSSEGGGGKEKGGEETVLEIERKNSFIREKMGRI